MGTFSLCLDCFVGGALRVSYAQKSLAWDSREIMGMFSSRLEFLVNGDCKLFGLPAPRKALLEAQLKS
eukprot:1158208-Pelagomonas_calceolata.AAC.57